MATNHQKVVIGQLSNTIDNILNEYSDEVIDAIKETVDEVTDEAKSLVKENAPKEPSGDYQKSIKSKTTSNTLTKKVNTIYADNGHYRLTHLLEFGHATVIKDGTYGGTTRTKAIPHFSKGEEFIDSELEKQIKTKIGG